MSVSLHPHRVDDRLWQAAHPLRPCVGKLRRRCMIALMLLLWSLIGIYIYLTNDTRVRGMAGDYLTGLLGGRVTIGSADLSLFEGLRLDQVRVTVPDGDGPQSTILEASSVLIHYRLRDLLAGRLTATQIIAIEPRVRLAEDVQSGQWNYQLLRSTSAMPAPSSAALQSLPEILLRDAQVDYLEVSGNQSNLVGWIALAGRLGQAAKPDEYEFSFQSRGRESLGPTIDGVIQQQTGSISASLRNFVFGPDMRAMLPNQVRQWCADHALAGQMNVAVDYTPGPTVADSPFHVQADLEGVQLSLNPQPGVVPFVMRDASGTLVFDNNGISVRGVTAHLDNNAFTVNGSINGYTPGAAADLTLNSVGAMQVPDSWPAVESLPPSIRQVYARFHPVGRADVSVHLSRATPGGRVQAQAQIDLIDSGFTFSELPYPIAHAAGRIVLAPDPDLGFDVVHLFNVHGHGIDGGPNAGANLAVSGWFGPFDHTGGGRIEVDGQNIHAEPELKAALPRQARAALDLLDVNHQGLGPNFTGTFVAVANREQAGKVPDLPWITDIDLDFTGGDATYAGFAYPLHDASAKLQIRKGYVNVIGLHARHGPASIQVDGRIDFDEKKNTFSPDLKLSAKDIPIDADLFAALPSEPRYWLQKTSAAGRLDADGWVNGTKLNYDLDLNLQDGSIQSHGAPAATNLAAQIHLTPTRMEVTDISGRRGDAILYGSAWMDWSGPRAVSALLHADGLALDDQLHALLPPQAKAAWDWLRPSGNVDAVLSYDNRQPDSVLVSSLATTQPSSGLQVTLLPRDLTVAPSLAPTAKRLRLDHVTGSVSVTPDQGAQWNVIGRRGDGIIALAGSWNLNRPHAPLNLRLSGRDLVVDANWVKSMPPGLAQTIDVLHLTGKVGFDFTKLLYRPNPTTKPDLDQPAVSYAERPDVDFAVNVACDDSSMKIGVPLDHVNGSAVLSGHIRRGELLDLQGDLAASSMELAGRPATDMQATLSKPAGDPTVRLTDLKGRIASGDLAGDLAVTLPDQSPSRYAISLILNSADVRQLTGTTDAKINGSVSASLLMSGNVADPSANQGRGDVRVWGGSMYQLPLLLGLFQVTNLALPINSPFERASARYNVQGRRVTLEKIQLAGKDVSMQGSGHIDFDTKQMDLTFDTANPTWLNIPLVGPMWQRAQDELLRIHVKGSLHSPSISATSLDTFTTTIDQVLKGDNGK